MKCKIISYMVPEGPPNAGTKAVCKCASHEWIFEGPFSPEMMCPIGRIEDATEKAIERISSVIETSTSLP
jgi:hypothetical protein